MKKVFKTIIMIGPGTEGLGGISRVIKNWQAGKILIDNQLCYFPTVNEGKNKLALLIKSFVRFCFLCSLRPKYAIYIHTASFHSFYRKSLFLAVALLFRKRVILHIHPSYFYHFISGFGGIKKKAFFSLLICNLFCPI